MKSSESDIKNAAMKVVEYLADEQADYAANPRVDHVYLSVKKLKAWCNAGVVSPPSFSDSFIREVQVRYDSRNIARDSLVFPCHVADFVRTALPDNSREHFMTLYLDGAKQVIGYSIISTGTADSSQVHPREVFQRAVLLGAVSIILSHNHPSGTTAPSKADKMVTERLRSAGDVLGISLLDHVIVTDSSYLSFLEEGLMAAGVN